MLVLALSVALAGCGGPEEKKAKFHSRALELFDKGDVVKARLEVKNALQIDPKFAEGYELLGRIELKEGNFKGGFGAFSKAVELKPELSVAQLELGKLFLMSNAPDQALEKAVGVIAREPQNADALLLKGSVLVVKKELEGAVALFEGPSGARREETRGVYPAVDRLRPGAETLQGGEGAAGRGRREPRLRRAASFSGQVLLRRHAPGPGRAGASQGDRARAGQAGAQVQPGQPLLGGWGARPRPST